MKEKKVRDWLCITMINLAILIMPVILDICRGKYYQPKEPEGFEEYVRESRKA